MRIFSKWLVGVLVLANGSVFAGEAVDGQRRAFSEHGRADNFSAPEAPSSQGQEVLDSEFPDPDSATTRQAEADREPSPGVHIEQIDLVGNTVFRNKELEELLAGYANRVLSVEDISELRLELSERYLRNGYVNSGVLVPSQDLADGVLRLEVVEGGLDEVRLLPGSQLRDRYVRSRVYGGIRGPLNLSQLRASLTQLQQDPNVARLDARLLPTPELGGSVLELEIEPAERFDVTIGADNHRAVSVGEERAFVSFGTRNLSGWGERLNVYAATAEGGENYSANLSLPLGDRVSVNLYGGDADAAVIEQQLDDLDIVSEFEFIGASLGLRLLNDQRRSLGVSLGWEEKDSRSTLGGEPYPLSPGSVNGLSRTRSLVAGVDYSRRRSANVLALRATYRHGLGVGGATEFNPVPGDELARLENPTGADGRYELWLYQGVLIQRLNVFPELADLHDRAQLVLRATLQRSSDPLMSLEKLAIGGANSVRGFRENLLVRDSGSALSAELQLPIPGYTSQPGWRSVLLSPYVDYGRAYDVVNANVFSSDADTSIDQIVVSVGIGVRWQPLRGMSVEVYWGEPIKRRLPEQLKTSNSGNSLQSEGIHAGLSYTLSF